MCPPREFPQVLRGLTAHLTGGSARGDTVLARPTDLGQHDLSGFYPYFCCLRVPRSGRHGTMGSWGGGSAMLHFQSNSFQVLLDASRGIPHAGPHACTFPQKRDLLKTKPELREHSLPLPPQEGRGVHGALPISLSHDGSVRHRSLPGTNILGTRNLCLCVQHPGIRT